MEAWKSIAGRVWARGGFELDLAACVVFFQAREIEITSSLSAPESAVLEAARRPDVHESRPTNDDDRFTSGSCLPLGPRPAAAGAGSIDRSTDLDRLLEAVVRRSATHDALALAPSWPAG